MAKTFIPSVLNFTPEQKTATLQQYEQLKSLVEDIKILAPSSPELAAQLQRAETMLADLELIIMVIERNSSTTPKVVK